MSIYSLLGVSADADAGTIKRAYAEKLRRTRPEDDPDGFQRLHEAYKMALQQSRQRTRRPPVAPPPTREPAATQAAEPAPPAHAPPATAPGPFRQSMPAVPAAAAPALDPAALVNEVIAHARADSTSDLRHWLEHCEALWSLEAKSVVGIQLMRALYQTAPPVAGNNQQVLLRFFDLDHVLAGHDPLALSRLRKSMHLAWILMPEHQHLVPAWLRQTHGYKGKNKVNQSLVQRCMKRLLKPYRLGWLLASALVPGRARRLRDFMLLVSGNDPACLPRTLDRRLIGFWLDAGTHRTVSKPRVLVGAARSVLLLILAGIAAGATQLHGSFGQGQPLHNGLVFVGALLPALAVLWWLWLGFQILDQWQSRDETEPARWPWACQLFVPVVALLGMSLLWMGPSGVIVGMLLLVLDAALAMRRLIYRRGKRVGRSLLSVPRLGWIGLFVVLRLAADTISPSLVLSLLGLSALSFWGMDLWAQRFKLRVRTRRTRTA